MHSVCCCSLPVWRSFLKKGTPCGIFWPHPGSAPGRIWPKNNNTCKGPWVLHPYQVSSKSIKWFWRRSWKCESLRTTTDGRRAMTIAHLSLRLRWAKKLQSIKDQEGHLCCRICLIKHNLVKNPLKGDGRGQGSHLCRRMEPKNINWIDNVENLLPVKIHSVVSVNNVEYGTPN